MFEVGFSELVMVALVSLLVIGPEQLPKVARLSGFWLAKARNMMSAVKTEINQELHEEEFRQVLRSNTGLSELENLMKDTAESVNAIKSSIEQPAEHNVKLMDKNEPK